MSETTPPPPESPPESLGDAANETAAKIAMVKEYLADLAKRDLVGLVVFSSTGEGILVEHMGLNAVELGFAVNHIRRQTDVMFQEMERGLLAKAQKTGPRLVLPK